MSRILARLAAFNFLVLLLTYGIGWLSYCRGSVTRADDSTYMVHFLLGLFAVLLTLAVHCLIFIYFLGTGRWVKEVALAYRIPDEPLPRLTRDLKRRTFPLALTAMLTIPVLIRARQVEKAIVPTHFHARQAGGHFPSNTTEHAL